MRKSIVLAAAMLFAGNVWAGDSQLEGKQLLQDNCMGCQCRSGSTHGAADVCGAEAI